MKRDLNLVREILLRLEPLSANPDQPVPLDIGKPPLDIPNYTDEQIVYHIRIMEDGGLISYSSGILTPGLGPPLAPGVRFRLPRFNGLRWQGHEFLDDVRDPKTWEATQKKFSKVGDVSLQVALEIARAYLRTHLPF
jgi:Hypothetical protein (DUF2513)